MIKKLLSTIGLMVLIGAAIVPAQASDTVSITDETLVDQANINQQIQRWGYFRDHAMWDELKTTFHPEGTIHITWYSGSIDGFIEGSIEMAKGDAKSMHVMHASKIDVVGDRAIAITPVNISGRNYSVGPGIDLDSSAQFFDFFEKRDGVWRIVRRHCIYQKDRISSIEPSFRFWLMSLFMDTDDYPAEYRYLAFALEQGGFPVQPDQIVDNSDASRALYQEGQVWLAKGAEAQ